MAMSHRLERRVVHRMWCRYSALPADARLVSIIGQRLGRDLADYIGPNTPEDMRQRAAFSTAVATQVCGAPQGRLRVSFSTNGSSRSPSVILLVDRTGPGAGAPAPWENIQEFLALGRGAGQACLHLAP
jgi:hypothetical protein